MKIIEKYLGSFIVAIWFFISIYLGCGGLTSLELADDDDRISKLIIDSQDTIKVQLCDSLPPFINMSAALKFDEEQKHIERKKLADSIFPWLKLPYSFMGLLITSFAFGALGGTISLLRNVSHHNVSVEDSKFLSLPFLGGGCGIIVLSVAYILPLLIVSGETHVRPLTIVFVSLFAGLFTEQFFSWLSSIFGKIFKSS